MSVLHQRIKLIFYSADKTWKPWKTVSYVRGDLLSPKDLSRLIKGTLVNETKKSPYLQRNDEVYVP